MGRTGRRFADGLGRGNIKVMDPNPFKHPASEIHTTIAETNLLGIAGLPKCQVTAEVQVRIDSLVEAVNAFPSDLASSEAP